MVLLVPEYLVLDFESSFCAVVYPPVPLGVKVVLSIKAILFACNCFSMAFYFSMNCLYSERVFLEEEEGGFWC